MSDPNNYFILYQNGEEAIDISPTAQDASTSIDLFGRDATNYGNAFWGNLVHMLEHFNSVAEPRNAIIGQLWFDGATLRVCTQRPTTLLTQAEYAATIELAANYRSDAIWLDVVLSDNGETGNNPSLASYVKRSYVDSRVSVTSAEPDTTYLSAGTIWYDNVSGVCKILVVNGTTKTWAPFNSITVANYANPTPVLGEVYLNTSTTASGLYVCTSFDSSRAPVWTNVTELNTNVTLTPIIGERPDTLQSNQMFAEDNKLKVAFDINQPVAIATLTSDNRLEVPTPVNALDAANKQFVEQKAIPVKMGNAASAVDGELYYGRPAGYTVDALVLKTSSGLIPFMPSGGSVSLNLPSASSQTSAIGGSIYFNNTDKTVKYFNSATWSSLATLEDTNIFGGTNRFSTTVDLAAPDGTAPITVNSTTLVPNLNVRTINGVTVTGNAFAGAVLSCTDESSATWTTGVSLTLDNVYTGHNKFLHNVLVATDNATPPFTIFSNKLVENLNVNTLNGTIVTGTSIPNYTLRATSTNGAEWNQGVWPEANNTFTGTNVFTESIKSTASMPFQVTSNQLISNLNAELINYTVVSGAAQPGYVLTGTDVNAATWQLPGASSLPDVFVATSDIAISQNTTYKWIMCGGNVTLADNHQTGFSVTICNAGPRKMIIKVATGVSMYVVGAGNVTPQVKLSMNGVCKITCIASNQYLLDGYVLDATPNNLHTGGLTVTGSLFVGSTLTVTNDLADVDGLGTFMYQWTANGVKIANATTSTYVPVVSDAGKYIGITVSYYDGEGNLETANLITSAAIQKVNHLATGTVTLTGHFVPGEFITANLNIADANGIPADAVYTYRWYIDGVALFGNNFNRYGVRAADVGKLITVGVSFTDGDGFYETIVGTAPRVVSLVNTPAAGTLAIDGSAIAGHQLTANTSGLTDFNTFGTFNWQWQLNGVAVPDAISNTYTPTVPDIGKVATVVLTYTDGDGFAESITSTPTLAITPENSVLTGTATIMGSLVVGSVLVVNTDSLQDANGISMPFNYQWKADGNDIVGATTNTHTVVQADAGKLLTVHISYVDDVGFAESTIATATAPISTANVPATGSITLSGTPIVGYSLTAVSTVQDVNDLGAFHYAWYANNVSIAGSTDSDTYVLTNNEVGKNIKVLVTYTDGGGHAEAIMSIQTAVVKSANIAPTGAVVINGNLIINEVLTANTSTLQDDNVLGTLHYQWKADGVNISGATDSPSFTTTANEVGKTISVVVTYVDGNGYAESITGTATDVIKPLNILPTGTVSITGNLNVGSTVTADTSALVDGNTLGTLHYQWKADGVVISSATDSSTYALTSNELGAAISVVVTWLDGAGYNESVTATAINLVDVALTTTTTTTLAPTTTTTTDALTTTTTTDALTTTTTTDALTTTTTTQLLGP